MKKLIFQIKRIIKIISDMTIGTSQLEYDLILGLITAPLIMLIELVSYFAIVPGDISSKLPFLSVVGFMLMFFVLFLLIYWNRIKRVSFLATSILFLYPYIIVLGGIMITFSYQGYTDRIESFFIAIIAAALVQIYPLRKRFAFFTLSIIAFNIMMLASHGVTSLFYTSLRLSIMIGITGYVYATFHYNVLRHQKKSLMLLDEQNIVLSESMTKLEKAYHNLNQSYEITESMMNSTMEILKNDRLDDVLQLVLEEAIRLIPKSQAGSVLVYNGSTMEFRAAIGYDLKKLQKVSLKLEDLFQFKLADKYEPTIINDLEVFDKANISQEKINGLNSAGAGFARSCLSCSFKYDGEFFGSLNLDNFDSNDIFDEHDKELLKHFSKEVEIVISIHKLYEKSILPSQFDELTKVYTRRYFNETFNKVLRLCEKTQSVLSVAMIDINNLKDFNDKFGHEIGDDYLISIIDNIREGIPKKAFIGRLGGDEFLIALPDVSFAKAVELVKNIRIKFHQTGFMASKSVIDASFAYGVSSTDELGYSASELLAMADSRMYEDKNQMKRR